jgi:hypothetical protein
MGLGIVGSDGQLLLNKVQRGVFEHVPEALRGPLEFAHIECHSAIARVVRERIPRDHCAEHLSNICHRTSYSIKFVLMISSIGSRCVVKNISEMQVFAFIHSHTYTNTYTYRHKHRQPDRQTDRQTDRHTGLKTNHYDNTHTQQQTKQNNKTQKPNIA